MHGEECFGAFTYLLAYGAGAVYLVERGNCSFVDKHQAVLDAGGSGMVLYDDIPGKWWAVAMLLPCASTYTGCFRQCNSI